jgi:SpoIID/LytB domain protein
MWGFFYFKNDRVAFQPLRRHRACCVVAALVAFLGLLALGLAFTPAAQAAPGDFVFNGRGWGHGEGMSQWGAWEAAKEGVTFDKILAFYYPGTTLEALPDPDQDVRVRISSQPWTTNTSVFSQVDLRPAVTAATLIEHSGSEDTSRVLPIGSTVTVRGVAGQVQVVTPAGSEGPFDYVELRPESPSADPSDGGSAVAVQGRVAIQLLAAGITYDYREYWGSMRVQPGDAPGDLWVYNSVPLERYLGSIAEVDYDWAQPAAAYAPEAVKAQAVAARTYAVAKNGPLADNQNDQCYVGYTGRSKPGETPFELKYPGIPEAAEDTAGLVITYEGKPISAFFSAHSGGYTTNSVWSGSSSPYIVSQPDPWSLKAPPASLSSVGLGYDWTFTISPAALSVKVNGHLTDTSTKKTVDLGLITRVEIVERDTPDPESHAKTLRLTGANGVATVSASSFRALFGYSLMRSTLILSVTGGELLAPGEFYDVGSSYIYHDQIARMVTDGLMSGYEGGLFKPDSPVTRWQFAKIAVNLYNVMHPDDPIAVVNVTTAPFGDVPVKPEETGDVSDWVAAAKKAGLVAGVSQTAFEPYVDVRRDQMASMLCRALGWEDEAAALPANTVGFADVLPGNPHWAAATYLKQTGIIQGYEGPSGSGTVVLRVDEAIKRQHVAVILCRVLDLPRD